MTGAQAPDWLHELPDAIAGWKLSLMDPDRFGLFRACTDAPMPFDFPSSAVCLGYLKGYAPDRLASLTHNVDAALRETGEYVVAQQREDGLFIDPQLDPRLRDREKPGVERDFRRAVTKYTMGLASALGVEPKYPYRETGGIGLPDGEAVLAEMRTRDWNRPWGAGSHAAGQARELFSLCEAGHEEYLPYTARAIEFILSQQNPETGMWGPSSIPLYEQISGTLKVLGRFVFYLGMEIPYVERLADSCIRHHTDGGFYADGDDMCFPRNVAEMCIACMETSDYRRDELRATLVSLAEFIGTFRQPDGAFASDRSGRKAIGWCGAHICNPPESPRSNLNGTQGAVWSLGMISQHLGWDAIPWKDPQGGWRERVAAHRYRVVVDGGHVEIVTRTR